MRWTAGLLLAVAWASTACTPTCAETCRSVLKCDGDPNVSQAECLESCERQLNVVEAKDDDGLIDADLKKAFAEHRRCVASSTCEELDEGVCYDERLFLLGDG